MKAILVIDVDNIDDIENTQATYIVLRNNNHTYQMSLMNHWLKPMPQRKKSLVVADGDGARFEEPTEFEQGWNTCIDEILGEEE